MSVQVVAFYVPGKNLVATFERVRDARLWNDAAQEWETAPTFADQSVPLVEGTGTSAGSYAGSNAGDMGDAHLVRVRLFDVDAGRSIGGSTLHVAGGEETTPIDFAQAERRIDDSGSQHQEVWVKRGTEIELLRYNINQIDGAPVTSFTQIPAQLVEPA